METIGESFERMGLLIKQEIHTLAKDLKWKIPSANSPDLSAQRFAVSATTVIEK